MVVTLKGMKPKGLGLLMSPGVDCSHNPLRILGTTQ